MTILSREEYEGKLPYEEYVERKKRRQENHQKRLLEEFETEWKKAEEYSLFCETKWNTIKQDILQGEIKTFNNPLYI